MRVTYNPVTISVDTTLNGKLLWSTPAEELARAIGWEAVFKLGEAR